MKISAGFDLEVFINSAGGLTQKILDRAIEIQQIPAPTFAESKRSKFVYQQFLAEGLTSPQIDHVGNVYGYFPGTSSEQPIVVSAHLDTVFPIETDLKLYRTADQVVGPGIGDNALGVAGLFGLIWHMKTRQPLKRDLWLVANVGEEGLGDLCGMQAVVNRFGDQPIAYIVLEGMAYGSIYHRGLGVRRFRISAHTEGGHSWVNFGRPSAIHELARLVTQIQDMPVPDKFRSSYNVGVIQGGTSINTIAAQASLELDLRSESRQALEQLIQQVNRLVDAATLRGKPDINFQVTQIGNRPMGEVSIDHPLPGLVRKILERQGMAPRFDIGSTDANVPLSRGYPAICIGLTTGRGAHTIHETIDIAPLGLGMSQVFEVVSGVDRLPG